MQFTEAAARVSSDRSPHSPMIGTRIGEYERWPHGGRRPSTYVLTVLASIYGTTVDRLLDYDDYRHLPDQDRMVLSTLLSRPGSTQPTAGPVTPGPVSPATATPAAHWNAAPADYVPVTPVLVSVGGTSQVVPVIPASAIVVAPQPPAPATATPQPAAPATSGCAAAGPGTPSEPVGYVDAPGLHLPATGVATGHATLTVPPGTALVTAATSLTPVAAISAAELEIAPRSGSAARRLRRDRLMDRCTGTASAEEEIIMAAAKQSAEFGEWAETTNVGPNTLDQFDQDVRTIARSYLRSAPLPLVLDTVRLRNRVFTQLEGRQHPTQSQRLYMIAGRACGLLAWMSGDVGRTAEAETQARTGWLCAEVADHDGLRAWIRATQSKSAYWDGRILDSARLAEAGLACRATGTARVLLASLAARAWARLGHVDEAHAALARAGDEREAVSEPDEVGGLFGFSEAQQSYLAGSTYLWLKESTEALRAADRAVWLYEVGEPEDRFYGAEMIALMDAASAHLQADELEGAIEKLNPVLNLPSQQRLETFTQRLGDMRAVLHRNRYVGNRIALDLQHQIEEFRATALGQYLSR